MSRTAEQQKQVEQLEEDIVDILTVCVSSRSMARSIIALPEIGIVDNDQSYRTEAMAQYGLAKLIPKE